VYCCHSNLLSGSTLLGTYIIAGPPEAKTYERRGPQTDRHLPQSPFTCQFCQITTFCLGFYTVNVKIIILRTVLAQGKNVFRKKTEVIKNLISWHECYIILRGLGSDKIRFASFASDSIERENLSILL
jgi:hypothetical protein